MPNITLHVHKDDAEKLEELWEDRDDAESDLCTEHANCYAVRWFGYFDVESLEGYAAEDGATFIAVADGNVEYGEHSRQPTGAVGVDGEFVEAMVHHGEDIEDRPVAAIHANGSPDPAHLREALRYYELRAKALRRLGNEGATDEPHRENGRLRNRAPQGPA